MASHCAIFQPSAFKSLTALKIKSILSAIHFYLGRENSLHNFTFLVLLKVLCFIFIAHLQDNGWNGKIAT